MANLTDSVKFEVFADETKNNGSPTPIPASGWVDTLGWNQTTWLLFLGAMGSGATVNMKIQESDDAISGADIAGKALSEIPDTGGKLGYAIEVPKTTASKRWQRAVCVVSNHAPGAALSIIAAKSAYSTVVSDVASLDLGQRV